MPQNLDDLRVFLRIADTGSFTAAAAQLGVSQSALSYTVRQLEERLKIKLLERTTRSVSTTAAGEALRQQITPLLAELDAKIENLNQFRDKLDGSLKITGNAHAIAVALWDKFVRFMREYPDIRLELDSSNRFTDIVAERFDAGIRPGQFVEKDMIALRVSPDMQMALVAHADLAADIALPQTPADLAALPCIAMRLPTLGNTLAWEFADPQSGKTVKIQPEGQFVCNQNALVKQAVQAGLGVAWLPRDMAAAELERGEWTELLPDWAIRYEGYYLYYPSRRADSAVFRALAGVLAE
ncbi:D-malate degradation protein R [Kingella potus]|uniref:D-malate degradation protein R n=1 Tax=Kingella potus TaxID=265175 RepID=A0A377R3F4_9NEIS|nr:LysR family transcriptional regulator [Kingella potus]UOP00431.1 LysR family transcriptional regulator [Kingella potus]STR02502.1 D-malate degradation protein R [Kingella potus]